MTSRFVISSRKTELDEDLLPVPEELINELGKDAVFDVEGEGQFTTKVSPPEEYAQVLQDGDIIRKGDTFALMAAQNAPFQPTEGKTIKVTIDGETWRVVKAIPEWSGEQRVYWELHLRG